MVRWNEPYQKLATCDASGIIFVWIRYEGRWSIELINDRNTPVIIFIIRITLYTGLGPYLFKFCPLFTFYAQVTHFAWSHDGRMAVIAYQVL